MFRHLVRVIVNFFRLAWPWIWRFIRLAWSLLTISVTSIYMGIPQSINRIADGWLVQASEAGLPQEMLPRLRNVARTVAGISMVLGWIIFANLTIILLRAIF